MLVNETWSGKIWGRPEKKMEKCDKSQIFKFDLHCMLQIVYGSLQNADFQDLGWCMSVETSSV